MKKLLVLLLASLLLVGCSTTTEPTTTPGATDETTVATNLLEEILAEGKIVVATSPDYAPFEFYDAEQNIVGSEVFMMEYIAEQLGVEVEWVPYTFLETMTAVQTNKVDVAISGYNWTPDRAEQMELSTGYNADADSESSCQGFLVKSENADQYTSLADFAGKTVGAQENSVQEFYVNTQLSDATREPVIDITNAIMSLDGDKIDAVALACVVAEGHANSSDGKFSVLDVKFELDEIIPVGNVIAAPKGEVELIEAINEIIVEINENGMFADFEQQAFDVAAAMGLDLEGE